MKEKVEPYPLRASSLVQNLDLDELSQISPIELTDLEQSQLEEFDERLFEEYKKCEADTVIANHVVYPQFFCSGEGRKLFFQIYQEGNPEYANLDENNLTDLSIDEVVAIFKSTNLKDIDKKKRSEANQYSAQKAQEEFKRVFFEKSGDVSIEDLPLRVAKLVSEEDLDTRLKELRESKKWFKQQRKQLTQEGELDSLSEAKMLLIDLYQRAINYKIADLYSSIRLVPSGLSEEQLARNVARMDHFIFGVGAEIGLNGLFTTMPKVLVAKGEERALETKDTNEEYENYNSNKIDADRMAQICEEILEAYSLKDGDKSWTVEISSSKKRMSVSLGKRKIYIPRDFNRGIIDALAVAAHEIEGHVLRAVNRGVVTLHAGKLVSRSDILSEAAAMRIEAQSYQEMVGFKRLAKPYYYLALREKERGGDFVACFKTYYDARMKFEPNADSSIVFDSVYDSTLRLFRNNTPLEDKSRYITTSEELGYLEQELLGEILENEKMPPILYVANIDLHSLDILKRLGMLDLDNLIKPKMVVARQIWPKVKEMFDKII